MNLPFSLSAAPEAFTSPYKMRSAFKQAEEKLRPIWGNEIGLKIIDVNTVAAWEAQWKPFFEENPDIEGRYYATWMEQRFIPESLDDHYLIENIDNFDNPAAFNLAVWHGQTLCGVACGGYKNENKRGFVSVMLREANPNPEHPLKGKIGPIINEAAILYAQNLGVSRVCYVGPYSAGAIKVHEAMGLKQEKIEHLTGLSSIAYTCHVPLLKASLHREQVPAPDV